MSFFLNPYEHDESPIEDEDRILCGCGDPRCWLEPNDASNVMVGTKWFNADCAGLCWPCGQVDDLRNLVRIGSYLMHEACALSQPIAVEGLEREARADEARDDDFMNRVRR